MRRLPARVSQAAVRAALPAVRAAVAVTFVALGLFALAPAVAAQAAAPTGAPPTAPPTTFPTQPPVSTAGGVITRSAHVAFEGCSARHITLHVSIAKDPFPIGQVVTYAVSVSNSGATACGPAQQKIPPLRRALTIGPCGVLPGVISNAYGLDVYPGREIFGCPLFWGVHLGAHATIRAEGTWMGYEALAGGPAGTIKWQKGPLGRYNVVVDDAVSVPFELAGAPSVPSVPPTLLPSVPPTLPPGSSRPTSPTSPITPVTPLAPNPNLPTPTTPATTHGLPTPTTPTTTVG
jgi:hypothetical protein